MEVGICSYSYHRLLKAGQHDVFRYILDCKELGCTQLDPWNGHLAPLKGDSEFLADGGIWRYDKVADAPVTMSARASIPGGGLRTLTGGRFTDDIAIVSVSYLRRE